MGEYFQFSLPSVTCRSDKFNTLSGGFKIIILSIFLPKLHENEKKMDGRGGSSLAAPWIRQFNPTVKFPIQIQTHGEVWLKKVLHVAFTFKNKLVKYGHKISQEIFTPNKVKQRSLNVLGKNWDEE